MREEPSEDVFGVQIDDVFCVAFGHDGEHGVASLTRFASRLSLVVFVGT